MSLIRLRNGIIGKTKGGDGSIVNINGYDGVVIGTQIWMLKNLSVSTFRDGVSINNLTSSTSWKYTTNPARCYYNNDSANDAVYGQLYNWYAVAMGNLSPEGWHVASVSEWQALVSYLASKSKYCCNGNNTYLAKSIASNDLWATYGITCGVGNDLSANNKTGFTGKPSGYRSSTGGFNNLTYNAYWWSSGTKCSIIGYIDTGVFTDISTYARSGYAVRCIAD